MDKHRRLLLERDLYWIRVKAYSRALMYCGMPWYLALFRALHEAAQAKSPLE